MRQSEGTIINLFECAPKPPPFRRRPETRGLVKSSLRTGEDDQGWRRAWKVEMIVKGNWGWRELYEGIVWLDSGFRRNDGPLLSWTLYKVQLRNYLKMVMGESRGGNHPLAEGLWDVPPGTKSQEGGWAGTRRTPFGDSYLILSSAC